MAKFEVIKAHDGLTVGSIKELPSDGLAAYMCENGFWKMVEDDSVKTSEVKKTAKRKK